MHTPILKILEAILLGWCAFSPQVHSAASLSAGSLSASTIQLVKELSREAPGVPPRVLGLAVEAASCERQHSKTSSPYLAVIDYSLPSTKKRFWLFDLDRKTLAAEELVAHGRGSGLNRATRFSNVAESRKSSLGLFRAGGTYNGKHGYSLYLYGLEQGVNENAYSRGIVMHGAPYVSEKFVARWKRLGRSWGCPSLSESAAAEIINRLKDGGLIFAYYPNKPWLKGSKFLNGCSE